MKVKIKDRYVYVECLEEAYTKWEAKKQAVDWVKNVISVNATGAKSLGRTHEFYN